MKPIFEQLCSLCTMYALPCKYMGCFFFYLKVTFLFNRHGNSSHLPQKMFCYMSFSSCKNEMEYVSWKCLTCPTALVLYCNFFQCVSPELLPALLVTLPLKTITKNRNQPKPKETNKTHKQQKKAHKTNASQNQTKITDFRNNPFFLQFLSFQYFIFFKCVFVWWCCKLIVDGRLTVMNLSASGRPRE